HLPDVSPPSTQVAGLCASSSTTGALTAPQQTFASASSGSGFSLFGTPSSAPSATTTSSLFTTPTTSAPVPSLFGTSVHFLRLHLPQVLQQVQGQALGLQVNHQSPKLELPGVSYNVRQPWIPGATSDLLESYNCHHFLLSLID
ncbi:unnamed protein product, partial [Vitis vinifera]